jgi:hypothetical protein
MEMIAAPPDVPCERGIFLSNLWYQHQQILVRYMGLSEQLVALPGKLQNGWQPGTGLDGEQGMKMEVVQAGCSFYLWSQRAERNALAEGLDWGDVIGAPFLYGQTVTLATECPQSPTLLAFPTHSVDPNYPVVGWTEYARDLYLFARAEGFERVVACLYWRDYESEAHVGTQHEPRVLFAAANVETVTLGSPFSVNFLDRFAALVRNATVVTSDRVCSAGMYALWLGRPFLVRGPCLAATHPELDIGPAGDPEYLKREFPELLHLDGQVHHEVADHELGSEFKRSPEELIRIVFGKARP